MGASLTDKNTVVDELVRNMGADFIAEVFFEELTFLLGDHINDILMVRNHGMNTRFQSKDVLSVDTKFVSVGSYFKENLELNLSRDSIYHQLPEILFHPLALNTKSGSNKEIVDTIRSNRKKEQQNLNFFGLFDTEVFKERVHINNRSLNFFFDSKSKKNVLKIFKNIIGRDLLLSDKSFYKLFLNLCDSEKYKEDLPELEKLINVVLGLKVKLSYVPHRIEVSPFQELGEAILGVDFGLSGYVYSEIDDVKAIILLEETVNDYKVLEKNIKLIKEVLNFFIISSRKVHVAYENILNHGFVLSEGFLGYDSYVTTNL